MIWSPINHFLQRVGRVYLGALILLVNTSQRRARAVLGILLALTVLALIYTATHFAVDTDTSNAISRDLPFQRLEHAYQRAFPQEKNTIIVVIKGKDPALVGQAADRLSQWLRTHPQQFENVYLPGGGSFFQRNGILYLSRQEVQSFANRVTDAQPLIARLSQDPSLSGLLGLMNQAIDQRLQGGATLPGLDHIFVEMRKAVDAQIAGQFYQLPWGALMGGGAAAAAGEQRFVIIRPVLDYHSLEPAAPALQTLRAGIADLHLDQAHGLDLGITGEAVLDSEQLKTVAAGAGMSLGLTFAVEILLLVVALRSLRLVSGVLLGLIVGMILTTAGALLVIGPFNLISVAFAILFIGLGVDFGIQFCMRYREEIFAGAPHPEALRRVAHALGGALSLAALAAALSFYAFVPTSYAGIVDLGLISGTSMLIALLMTLTLLPAFLTLWPARQRPAAHSLPHPRLTSALVRYPIHRYAYGVLAMVMVLAVLAVPAVLRASFDFNPLSLIDPHVEGVKVFRQLLAEPGASPYRIEIVAPNLSAANALAARLDKLPTVSQAVTLASYIPAGQTEKLAILQNLQILVPPFSLLMPATLQPPAADAGAALTSFAGRLVALSMAEGQSSPGGQAAMQLQSALQRFHHRYGDNPQAINALQERIMGGLPPELQRLGMALTAAPVTLQSLPEDLRTRYITPQGQARIEVFPKANLSSNAAMLQFVRNVQQVAPQAVGTPVMLVEGGEAVLGAFQEATVIALVTISLLLLLVLRCWRDTLLVMAPLLLAALFTVASMSYLGLSFNLGNIIVLPLLIGLGVAFAIYIVARWRSGTDIAHLLQTSTPMAVFFSGITTLSAFGSMAISLDPGMASLGKTLSLALAMVLLCILIVLPALLLLFTHSPREQGIAQDEGR
ncbi:MAG: MMPL family transporter [Acidithiobacillus sp.]